MIKVTEVRLYGQPRGRLVSLASIIIEDCFAIKDIRIIRSFEPDAPHKVLMPSRARQDGSFAEYCHPIRKEVRTAIEDAILSKLNSHAPATAK